LVHRPDATGSGAASRNVGSSTVLPDYLLLVGAVHSSRETELVIHCYRYHHIYIYIYIETLLYSSVQCYSVYCSSVALRHICRFTASSCVRFFCFIALYTSLSHFISSLPLYFCPPATRSVFCCLLCVINTYTILTSYFTFFSELLTVLQFSPN